MITVKQYKVELRQEVANLPWLRVSENIMWQISDQLYIQVSNQIRNEKHENK